jgi:hypothetical protein
MRDTDGLGGIRSRSGQRANIRAALLLSMTLHLACVWLATIVQTAKSAAAEAAADQPPLSIAIFVSSRKDVCFDPGEVAAIKRLARAEQDRINATGGILRRRLQLQVLDDDRVPERTIANLKEALANPHTVAMLGLSATDRAKAAFDALGGEIGRAASRSCPTSASPASSRSRPMSSPCARRRRMSASRSWRSS